MELTPNLLLQAQVYEMYTDDLDEMTLNDNSVVCQAVDLIIRKAIESRAKYIHIEPRQNKLIVRYRVDSALKQANILPRIASESITFRIKMIGNMDPNEKRIPQSGTAKISLNGSSYSLHITTLPIEYGEKIVLGIIDQNELPPKLEELGFWGDSLSITSNEMKQPRGVILVTSKDKTTRSTTLSSLLQSVNNTHLNIATLEDPIQFKITGANQTQINERVGLSYELGLKNTLRQDPDIIMVENIDSLPVAQTIFQVAQSNISIATSLSGVKAAQALVTATKYFKEPAMVANCLKMIIAQQVVRRLCPNCREQYIPDQEMLNEYVSRIKKPNSKVFQDIHVIDERAIKIGISKDASTKAATSATKIKHLWRANEHGCNSCGHTGYLGQIYIHELLEVNDHTAQLVVSGADENMIETEALKSAMIPIEYDGIVKALRGLTTIDEVERVLKR